MYWNSVSDFVSLMLININTFRPIFSQSQYLNYFFSVSTEQVFNFGSGVSWVLLLQYCFLQVWSFWIDFSVTKSSTTFQPIAGFSFFCRFHEFLQTRSTFALLKSREYPKKFAWKKISFHHQNFNNSALAKHLGLHTTSFIVIIQKCEESGILDYKKHPEYPKEWVRKKVNVRAPKNNRFFTSKTETIFPIVSFTNLNILSELNLPIPVGPKSLLLVQKLNENLVWSREKLFFFQ